MPIIQPSVGLSTRQEAFCRHYAVLGNAADAARQAGYSERSARQTGCALLERPYIAERPRRIRLSWKRTERDEARIVLARLEQVWDAAVASGSAHTMLRVLRFQAEIAGLVKPAGFDPPPPPANDLPPPPALAKAGDDPPEETYEDCPWAPDGGFGGDDGADNERADNAGHDRLYQRRYGYDEIYDRWAPEEVEERRRARLEREEVRDREDFGFGEDDDRDGDEDEFAPDHDIA